MMTTNDSHKRCSKCKEWKSKSAFCKNKKTGDKLNGWCRECVRIISERYRRSKGIKPRVYALSDDKRKRCSKCKAWKMKSKFSPAKNSRSLDKLNGWCKSCKNEYLRLTKRKRLPNPQTCRPPVRAGLKWCSRCRKWKQPYEFYSNKYTKYKLECYCINCFAKYQSKTSIKEVRRKWRRSRIEYVRIWSRVTQHSLRTLGKGFSELSENEKYVLLHIRLFKLVTQGKIQLSEARRLIRDFRTIPKDVFFRTYKHKTFKGA